MLAFAFLVVFCILLPMVLSYITLYYFEIPSFSQIIFLLIIWDLHTVHSNHTCFPFLPNPHSHPCDRPQTKNQKTTKSNSHCPYTYQSLVKLSAANPSKKTESLPTPTPPEAINREEPHLSISTTSLKHSPR